MATYWPTTVQIARGVIEARWVATGFTSSTAVVQPAELTGYPDRVITVESSDFNGATIKLYGSNTPLTSAGPMTASVATGVPISDPTSTGQISFASDISGSGAETILDATRWVYWTATVQSSATGANYTVRILASQRRS